MASRVAGKRRVQRGSRNNKRNMRKKIDMDDVEEHFEHVRHEERTGFVLILVIVVTGLNPAHS